MLLPRLSRVGGTKWIPRVVAYCSFLWTTEHDGDSTLLDLGHVGYLEPRSRTNAPSFPNPLNSCRNQAGSKYRQWQGHHRHVASHSLRLPSPSTDNGLCTQDPLINRGSSDLSLAHGKFGAVNPWKDQDGDDNRKSANFQELLSQHLFSTVFRSRRCEFRLSLASE